MILCLNNVLAVVISHDRIHVDSCVSHLHVKGSQHPWLCLKQIEGILKYGNGNRKIIYHDKNGPVMGIGNAANIFITQLQSDMVTLLQCMLY